MKKIKLYLILLLPFFSCEKNLPKQDKVSKSESKTISEEKISETNDERTWKEYKRRPVNSITDESPYNGCFFKIKNFTTIKIQNYSTLMIFYMIRV